MVATLVIMVVFGLVLRYVALRLAHLWDPEGPASRDQLYWYVYRGLVFWGAILVGLPFFGLILCFALSPLLGLLAVLAFAVYSWQMGWHILNFEVYQVISSGSDKEAPEVGLPTLWGRYLPDRTVHEGHHLVFTRWPVRYWYIPIKVSRRNIDIEVNVRTNPSDEAVLAKITFSAIAIPDWYQPHRLPGYLRLSDGNQDGGLKAHLDDVAGKHGIIIAAGTGWQDLYRRLSEISNQMIDNVTEGNTHNDEDLEREERNGGVPDKFGWGVRILRIRAKAIKLLGKFQEVADTLAVEKMEREGRAVNQRTIQELVRIIRETAPKMSQKEAIQLASLMEARDGLTAYAHAMLAAGGKGQSALPVLPLQSS